MTPQQERAAAHKDKRIAELEAIHSKAEMTVLLGAASTLAICDVIYNELQTPRAVEAMNDLFNTAITMTALHAGFTQEDDDLVGELIQKGRELVNEVNDLADSKIITANNVIQMPQ